MSLTFGDAAGDALRRSRLRQMKAIATGMFVLAALTYIATVAWRDVGWRGFVNAGAEAAMVGAVADWFAVTALFRHPLGLKIPHTAIIPTRKDAIGANLEEFVGTHFLSEDVVRAKVGSSRIAYRVGLRLRERPVAERICGEAATAAGGALKILRDDSVVPVLEEIFVRRLLMRPWGPPSGRLLADVLREGTHHRLVDVGADHLEIWLREHEEIIERILLDRAPAWTPAWLDQRVAQRAYLEALSFAADVRADPNHRARKALDDLLAEFADSLQHDPATQLKADTFRDRLLAHPDLRQALTSLWTTVRTSLEDSVQDPNSDLRLRVTDAIQAFGERLVDDTDLQHRLDGYAEDAAAHLVTSYRDEVVAVISETVHRWDGAETSELIETHIGRDLQFIRINGTVVGGVVGLSIHALTVLFT